jgi:hypothetical protein
MLAMAHKERMLAAIDHQPIGTGQLISEPISCLKKFLPSTKLQVN